MKAQAQPKNILFYERFKKNWRLKIGPRTGPVSFRPASKRADPLPWQSQVEVLATHR